LKKDHFHGLSPKFARNLDRYAATMLHVLARNRPRDLALMRRAADAVAGPRDHAWQVCPRISALDGRARRKGFAERQARGEG